jgi:hypothetical protein
VGERPAGAERGEGRAIDVLSLFTGDLAWRMVRDRGVAIGRDTGSADLLVLRIYEAGFAIPLLGKKALLSDPLDRLKSRGSTFSKSSSIISDAFLFPATGGEMAAAG